MTPIRDRLLDLARRIRRNTLRQRDSVEDFLGEQEDIAETLQRMAREVEDRP